MFILVADKWTACSIVTLPGAVKNKSKVINISCQKTFWLAFKRFWIYARENVVWLIAKFQTQYSCTMSNKFDRNWGSLALYNHCIYRATEMKDNPHNF